MNFQQRVLRKFRTLDGRRLIGHEIVAIPYARLRIGLHVYEEVSLPPLDDGILRLVGIMDSAGLSVADVCRFLGVPPSWSDDRIVELRRQELITIAGASNPTVRITDRGRMALVKEGDARPAFREVHAHLNLVTRRLELVDDMERISPCKCPAKDRSEFEVLCARCECINIARVRKLSGRAGADPAGADFALEALQDLINRQMPRFRRRSSDLKRVRIAGLAGAPQHVGTFYREAILMGFHVEGGAPAVEVVVGGEVDPLIGDVVQSQSWVGEIKSDLSRTPVDLTAALGALGLPVNTSEAKASIAAEAAVESVEEKLRNAEARLDDTEPGPQREETQVLLSRLERDRARALEVYLSQAFVKTHDPLQLGKWFELALRTCTHRLLIESATISPLVVKPVLIDQLRTVLERGVQVVVAIGMPWGKSKLGVESRKGQEDRAKAERLLDMLAEVQRDHSDTMQLFAGNGDKHDKQLICDDWYVDGGKNWLSSPSGADAIDGNGTKIRSPLTNDGAWKETIKWYTSRKYHWSLNL